MLLAFLHGGNQPQVGLHLGLDEQLLLLELRRHLLLQPCSPVLVLLDPAVELVFEFLKLGKEPGLGIDPILVESAHGGFDIAFARLDVGVQLLDLCDYLFAHDVELGIVLLVPRVQLQDILSALIFKLLQRVLQLHHLVDKHLLGCCDVILRHYD